MKKDKIRKVVEGELRSLGFKPNQWRWSGCTLDLVVGGGFRSIRFPAGLPMRAVSFEIGRITGWVEALALVNDVQAHDPVLASIAGLTAAAGAVNGAAKA